MTTDKRESVKVLEECIDIQNRKGSDYQNASSTVRQADYYRLGADSIYDMMHTKMLRIQSLLDAAKNGPTNGAPNFESIEDSAKDLINYSSFMVSYLRGKVDGQDPNKTIFNRPKPAKPVTLSDVTSSSGSLSGTARPVIATWAPPEKTGDSEK